jgi:sugar transferase (PEP-CTERM/EpsH1 system associated)
LLKVLRSLRPDIVHTRNLAALEFQATAALAGVPCRIHSEHGRDIYDLDGTNFKYNALRKVMRLFIDRYIAVSRNLSEWLVETVSVSPKQVTQIYNGVDSQKFGPRIGHRSAPSAHGFGALNSFVVGTIGRMEPVKNQLTLVRAFLHLLRETSGLRERLRLVIIGDGSLKTQVLQMLQESQAEQFAWLPGERADIPDIMRDLDLFVLPSLREGISNTILEAMASGLPVVATNVGGNPELVRDGETGLLVSPSDPIAMANAIRVYMENPKKREEHGAFGRRRVEAQFSMAAMIDGYLSVYDTVLSRKKRLAAADLTRLSTSENWQIK